MGATLTAIRDEIRARSAIYGTPELSDALLNRIINLAQRELQLILFGASKKYWEKTDSPALSASTWKGINVKKFATSVLTYSLLDVPDAISLIECGDGSTTGIAHPVSVEEFGESLGDSYLAPTLVEPIFTLANNEVILAPSTITTAKIYYYGVAADLSSDSDQTSIPPEHEGELIKRAMIEVDDIVGRLNDKQEAIAQFTQDITNALAASASGLQAEFATQSQPNARLQ